MLENFYEQKQKRKELGIPPLTLTKEETQEIVKALIKTTEANEGQNLKNLLIHHVAAGIDEASKVKSEFLYALALEKEKSVFISPKEAVFFLGTMVGGYNVTYLIELLEHPSLAKEAANQLKETLLIFDKVESVFEKMKQGNSFAKEVMESWANGEWFTTQAPLAEKIILTVFKVDGETTTDDLSPAPDAFSRSDIPYHALSMLKNPKEGLTPIKPGVIGPINKIEELKKKGNPIVYVGDVVGTGSSRKSATNSLIWHFGQDIPYVPNKRRGGFCFAEKIPPIFYNTQEDSGAFPVEMNVSEMNMGEVIEFYPYKGFVTKEGKEIARFELPSKVILDEVRVGGRVNLIIGKALTQKARKLLGLNSLEGVFNPTPWVTPKAGGGGFTLAQKLVGFACGLSFGEGVLPGSYCEPHVSTVGSQDTTGSMTRDELKDIACLKFNADFVMQSFCHTAAYPNESDILMQQTLPSFFTSRGGVALSVGDGVIHSWLNRFALPNTLGTGADSHTRFPIGISFPGGSGLVAFAAATGTMPLSMPESVLVRFKGKMNPNITLRDLVNAIPYYAIKKGLLTLDKKNKKNIFSGRILEIQGLESLKAEQAFELADASAERSAAACTVALDKEPVIEYIKSNIALLENMIKEGYKDSQTLRKRIEKMKDWLKNPVLLKADDNGEYKAIIEIDIAEITEPLLACPNDPDDIKTLSQVAKTIINEAFIGSCMINIGHFRAAGRILENKKDLKTQLWVAPPTRMDANRLREEGIYSIFGKSGARIEMAGCSLCMGNQAQVKEGATVISTSTRNFPNRLGLNTKVFLGSAELAAISAKLGYLPTLEEYKEYMKPVVENEKEIYRYLQFDEEKEDFLKK